MATIFSHSLVGVTLATLAPEEIKSKKFYFWMFLLPIIPDFDSIGFKFHIAYDSFWGHRGFTHSILFSLLVAFTLTALQFRKPKAFAFLFLAILSHPLIDPLTNGGLGVALFSPFINDRYFFLYRPIEVSPIGAGFFSMRGLQVLESELFWLVLPCFVVLIWSHFRKKKQKYGTTKTL